jgi:hypothetical protein
VSGLVRLLGPMRLLGPTVNRRRASRPWYWAHRDPQWEAPLDPPRDPIDKDGFTPHERRIWLRWLNG